MADRAGQVGLFGWRPAQLHDSPFLMKRISLSPSICCPACHCFKRLELHWLEGHGNHFAQCETTAMTAVNAVNHFFLVLPLVPFHQHTTFSWPGFRSSDLSVHVGTAILLLFFSPIFKGTSRHSPSIYMCRGLGSLFGLVTIVREQ